MAHVFQFPVFPETVMYFSIFQVTETPSLAPFLAQISSREGKMNTTETHAHSLVVSRQNPHTPTALCPRHSHLNPPGPCAHQVSETLSVLRTRCTCPGCPPGGTVRAVPQLCPMARGTRRPASPGLPHRGPEWPWPHSPATVPWFPLVSRGYSV